MAAIINIFKESILDLRRFTDENDEAYNCWEVVEMILKPFNCQLKQHKGKYTITNYHELNSPAWIYDWDTLTLQSNTMNTNVINADDRKYSSTIEQQKVKQLKGVDITLRTSDLPEDITGRDLSHWTTVWIKKYYSALASTEDPKILVMYSLDPGTGSENNSIKLASPFSISKESDDEYFILQFDYRLISVTQDSTVDTSLPAGVDNPSSYVTVKIEVQYPDGIWYETTNFALTNTSWKTFLSTGSSNVVTGNITENWGYKVTSSGQYNVRISIIPTPGRENGTWKSAKWEITDIQITMGSRTIYDTQFYQEIETSAAISNYETEMYVSDADQVSFLGALLKYDVASEAYTVSRYWNTYGGTEEIKLLDIYARNILNNRARYKNYLKLKIYDPSNTITFNSIIQIKDRYYVFSTFKKDYLNEKIEAELIELNVVKQTYAPIVEKTLTTVNGAEETEDEDDE